MQAFTLYILSNPKLFYMQNYDSDFTHSQLKIVTQLRNPVKNPDNIPCPISGYYQFHQTGSNPMVSRIMNGITDSPRPRLSCNRNISSFKVCDAERKEIVVDVEENVCVDYLGRPLDIYSK